MCCQTVRSGTKSSMVILFFCLAVRPGLTGAADQIQAARDAAPAPNPDTQAMPVTHLRTGS
jgi:hypothetical protein